MAEPYLKKDPGDIIRAQDWNDMQSAVRAAVEGHAHTGGAQGPLLNGAAIAPDAALAVKAVAASDTLSVKGRDVASELDKLGAGVGDSLPLKGGTLGGELVAGAGLRLADRDIALRLGSDANHGLGYYGGAKRFAGLSLDGPALYGFGGGALGTTSGGQRAALTWDPQQNVAVNGALTVAGSINAAGSDLYFTQNNHVYTGKGNAAGNAALENDSKDYKALMILGRAGEKLPNGATGRYVRLWDYLSVEGDMRATGSLAWAGGGSQLRNDQGGSIELGGNDAAAGTGTPYIDFHFTGKKEDFNVRIINDFDGGLSVSGRLRILKQEPWTSVTGFQNGWVNYGGDWAPAAFMKDSAGFVHLRGLLRAGAVGSGKTMFVLPGGYRPEVNYLHCISIGGEGSGRINVFPDGRVEAYAGNSGWFSLDGIVFLGV